MNKARKRKYHYIYKITRFDGAYYIGLHSTDNLNDGYFGSGQRLWYSIKYHGKDKHKKEILEFLPTREALVAREKHLVNHEMLADTLCLNLREGGSYVYRKEQKEEANVIRRNSIIEFYKSERGAEAKRKISEANTGKVRSIEAKQNYAKAAKVRMKRMQEDGSWEAVKQKNRIAHIGKTHTPEEVQYRMSCIKKKSILTGRARMSEQARKNIAESQLGDHNQRAVKTWRLTDAKSGESFVIKGLEKWLRENDLVITRDRKGIKKKIFRAGEVLFLLENLGYLK